jgi:hypothetical protein
MRIKCTSILHALICLVEMIMHQCRTALQTAAAQVLLCDASFTFPTPPHGSRAI